MNTPKDILVREYYIDKIKPFINKGLIKVITGQDKDEWVKVIYCIKLSKNCKWI